MEEIPQHPSWILGKLKSKIADVDVDVSTGLTGSMIDSRLQPVFMDGSDLTSDNPRAVWDATARKFVIITDNSVSGEKIKEFILTDDNAINEEVANFLAAHAEDRDRRAFDFARNGKWVWDYEDQVASAKPGPTNVDLNPGPTPTPTGSPTPGTVRLDPPTFSIASGTHPLASFPLALTLGNPNNPAISRVYYRTALIGWQVFDGTPIAVEPGTEVKTFAKSLDSDNYTDSYVVDGDFRAAVVTPHLTVSGPTAVSWAQVGGALMPGGPAPELAHPLELWLANGEAIPDQYESSLNFAVYRTLDGSDPRDAGSDRTLRTEFTGGFAEEAIDLSLPEWGTKSNFNLRAVVQSLNPAFFNDSNVAEHVVDIAPTTLRQPLVSSNAEGIVTISLDASFGDMPAGARVYYTVDGTDPGNFGGDPVTGTEYTGPFSVKNLGSSAVVRVVARVYGTDNFEHWFVPSSVVASDVLVPAADLDFDHAVSLTEPE
jgi:hypothetical protein